MAFPGTEAGVGSTFRRRSSENETSAGHGSHWGAGHTAHAVRTPYSSASPLRDPSCFLVTTALPALVFHVNLCLHDATQPTPPLHPHPHTHSHTHLLLVQNMLWQNMAFGHRI